MVDDDQGAADHGLACGGVEVTRNRLGESDPRQPEELPGRLEQQQGQQLDRVPRVKECQQRQGGEEAQRPPS